MFKRITVVYNESAESARALLSAIRLAKTLGSELTALTSVEDSPSYAAFAAAGDPSLAQTLTDDRLEHFARLQAEAREVARRNGVDLVTHLLEGGDVNTIVGFLLDHKTDLLVIGLRRHSLYISRLWSAVYGIAQDAPCSVLGVH